MQRTKSFARPSRTFGPREMAKLEAKISALKKTPRFKHNYTYLRGATMPLNYYRKTGRVPR